MTPCGPARSGYRVEQESRISFVLHQSLAFSITMFRTCTCLRRLVEGGGDETAHINIYIND